MKDKKIIILIEEENMEFDEGKLENTANTENEKGDDIYQHNEKSE